MSAELYEAVARCRLNFYPGTMEPTRPDYRRELRSEPMSREYAMMKLIEWRSVVRAPGWEFTIEAAAAGGVGEGREG